MFGKEYAKHQEILIRSFSQMTHKYEKKKTLSEWKIEKEIKKIYLSIFGIPEIGFQVRSVNFFNILHKHLIKDNGIKNILDAGSGIGFYAFWLAKKISKSKIVGGDIDKQKLSICKRMKKEFRINNVSFIYFDILKKQSKSKYDLILTIDVLEHVKNYKLALRNFYKLLRKKGYLYIHVPQPNQQRIFKSLKKWHHEDHDHEGIEGKMLIRILNNLGFKIIVTKETYGIFGKFAWEINHYLLGKNFLLAGITFPILYILVLIDAVLTNKNGLGILVLAQKK